MCGDLLHPNGEKKIRQQVVDMINDNSGGDSLQNKVGLLGITSVEGNTSANS